MTIRWTQRCWLSLVASLTLVGVTACSAYKSLVGENTITLEAADVERMESDIRSPIKKICPRAPVQMLVTVDARLGGQASTTRVETWSGDRSVRRNGKLDFGNFLFASPQGGVDEFGWFQPNPDVLASLESGFVITTTLKYQPDRFSVTKRYDPEYACVVSGGANGRPGGEGMTGSEGADGVQGRGGFTGGPGVPGSAGHPGQPGEAGPRLQAYATLVRTRLYERVLAIRIEGALRDLLLAPPDGTVTLYARGGDGGAGGPGGTGGDGGRGGRGSPGRSGGPGGAGGPGGNGGSGSSGGLIDLVYDARFPDLARLIVPDVTGGTGGVPGTGGLGGSGGPGGPGRDDSQPGPSGPSGSSGPSGIAGASGQPGTTRARPGTVADRLRNLPGIQPL